MTGYGEVPFKLHLDGECTYHDCTLAEGHEVCRPIWDWIRELAEAIEAGDLARALEIKRRLL